MAVTFNQGAVALLSLALMFGGDLAGLFTAEVRSGEHIHFAEFYYGYTCPYCSRTGRHTTAGCKPTSPSRHAKPWQPRPHLLLHLMIFQVRDITHSLLERFCPPCAETQAEHSTLLFHAGGPL